MRGWLVIGFALALFAADQARADEAPATVSVCFTPAEHCSGLIVAAIDAARSTIRVQAYQFTAAPILAALVRGKRRGVDVQVILDRINDRSGAAASYTGATFVAAADIPVWIDWRPAIAHSKAIVIDHELVIGGSYNYTRAAEARNAENVLYIRSPAVAGRFEANWESRRDQSRPYTPADKAGSASASLGFGSAIH